MMTSRLSPAVRHKIRAKPTLAQNFKFMAIFARLRRRLMALTIQTDQATQINIIPLKPYIKVH